MTFTRGTEGQRVPLQAGHLLAEVTAIVEQTFPKSIEIRRWLPSSRLWPVLVDPTQLHQVVMNLCVNARDAMPGGGSLMLSAENCCIDEVYARMTLEAHPGNYLVITVADTGVGIVPDLLDRIFDPFFTTKEPGKGTGLGLSTVLGIVKNCDGFIQVTSEIGKGTQFKVFLPAIEGTALEPEGNKDLPGGHNELILIVDDELAIQRSSQSLLESYGYRTLLANDGIEALAQYAEHRKKIQVVLMDMMMPAMDGLTAIHTLKKMNPNIKIIATSGLLSSTQQIFAAGASSFLPKPYTAQELLVTVRNVLEKTLECDR